MHTTQHQGANWIHSLNLWQNIIPKVDQIVGDIKCIILACNLCTVIMPYINLHKLHDFNKIHNTNVLNLNHLNESMQWFKQGHEVMETKHNLNTMQYNNGGLCYITYKLICPHLHDDGLVFCQHLFRKRHWQPTYIHISKDLQCFHIQQNINPFKFKNLFSKLRKVKIYFNNQLLNVVYQWLGR